MPDQPKLSPEESFKGSLEDLILIGEKLAPLVLNVQDLLNTCRLALEHECQLNLLMAIVKQKGK